MNPIVIESHRTLRGVFADLWDYRELFWFLAWRDLLVRYKQTVLGLAWSVITLLLTMAVLTVVFGRLARLPDGGAPYPVLVFAGLLPWLFFSSVLTQSSQSLVNNRNLVARVYFPRIIIPADFLGPTSYRPVFRATIYNERALEPRDGVTAVLDVESAGRYNRAYLGDTFRGKLAPALDWKTERMTGASGVPDHG